MCVHTEYLLKFIALMRLSNAVEFFEQIVTMKCVKIDINNIKQKQSNGKY